jgi:hypothetical protein
VSRRPDAAASANGSGPVGLPIALALPAARAWSPIPVPDQTDLLPVPGRDALMPANAGSRVEGPPRADPLAAAADADEIVERAWRELMSRLAIEQERRGFGRWG